MLAKPLLSAALTVVLFAAGGLLMPGHAVAQAIFAPENEHFTMSPTEGGYLRMNKETGAVSFCAVKEGVATCRVGAEERVALEAEIDRLRKDNAVLGAQLKAAGGSAAGRPPPRATPSDEEFERALSFTERFLRRIMRLFREEAPPGDRL